MAHPRSRREILGLGLGTGALLLSAPPSLLADFKLQLGKVDLKLNIENLDVNFDVKIDGMAIPKATGLWVAVHLAGGVFNALGLSFASAVLNLVFGGRDTRLEDLLTAQLKKIAEIVDQVVATKLKEN